MPLTKPQRPRTKAQLLTGTQLDTTDEETNSRLLNNVSDAHKQLEGQLGPTSVVIATLTAGANVVNHGLGRQPRWCGVMPTVADAAFAWAMTAADTKQATITTVGPSQPLAAISFA